MCLAFQGRTLLLEAANRFVFKAYILQNMKENRAEILTTDYCIFVLTLDMKCFFTEILY